MDGLVQDCSNSIANALELLQSSLSHLSLVPNKWQAINWTKYNQILQCHMALPVAPFTNMVSMFPAWISNYIHYEVWDEIG